MTTRNLSTSIFKLVLPLFLILFAQAANAQTYTQAEQNCFDQVQNKVAWDKAGNNKAWGESNIRALCKGTTTPEATISCFTGIVSNFDDYVRGIRECQGATSNPLALPQGFVACAKEGEQCEFRGTKEVRYGADSRWKIMTVTNGVKCDYVTFGGDPAYGTHKQCYISSASTPVNVSGTWKVTTPNQSWTTMTITQNGPNVTLAYSVKVSGQMYTETESGYVTDDRIFIPLFELTGTVFGNGTQIKWSSLPDRLNNNARPSQLPNATLARSEWELQTIVATTTNTRNMESDLPLSTEDMAKVMKWIATRVAADQVPYCYKQTTYNKKIPEIGKDQCLSDQTGEVVPCYQPCPAGHPSDGNGECTGYVDEVNKWCTSPLVMVAAGNCRKPEAYGRGGGYTHFMIDPEGACKKDNPSTGCESCATGWSACGNGRTPGAGSDPTAAYSRLRHTSICSSPSRRPDSARRRRRAPWSSSPPRRSMPAAATPIDFSCRRFSSVSIRCSPAGRTPGRCRPSTSNTWNRCGGTRPVIR